MMVLESILDCLEYSKIKHVGPGYNWQFLVNCFGRRDGEIPGGDLGFMGDMVMLCCVCSSWPHWLASRSSCNRLAVSICCPGAKRISYSSIASDWFTAHAHTVQVSG